MNPADKFRNAKKRFGPRAAKLAVSAFLFASPLVCPAYANIGSAILAAESRPENSAPKMELEKRNVAALGLGAIGLAFLVAACIASKNGEER